MRGPFNDVFSPVPDFAPGWIGIEWRQIDEGGAPELETGANVERKAYVMRSGIKAYWRDAFLRLPFFTSMHRYLPALFQTYGHEVAYVPVNDRPRQAGVSKYNNLNRALVGLYDLVGVSWLRRRTNVPLATEHNGEAAAQPDTRPATDDIEATSASIER